MDLNVLGRNCFFWKRQGFDGVTDLFDWAKLTGLQDVCRAADGAQGAASARCIGATGDGPGPRARGSEVLLLGMKVSRCLTVWRVRNFGKVGKVGVFGEFEYFLRFWLFLELEKNLLEVFTCFPPFQI